MKFKAIVSMLLFTGTLASTAHAESGITREQVQAELAEAIRMGDIPISDTGQTPRDINPSAYPREQC